MATRPTTVILFLVLGAACGDILGAALKEGEDKD